MPKKTTGGATKSTDNNKSNKSKPSNKKSSNESTFQATKKNLIKSRKDGKVAVAKAQEDRRAAKNKNTKKHINARANFVIDADMDRISIKKKLQQLDQKRAADRAAGITPDTEMKDDETTSTTTPSQTDPTPTTSKSQTAGTKTDVPQYYKNGKTLIVGDGDFSFTASLLQYRSADPQNITATTYDTLNQVKYKYRDTYAKHLEFVHLGPAIVLNGIDATNLTASFPNPFTTTQLPPGTTPSPIQSVIKIQYPFDRILFNFPHSGEQRVHINRQLLANFFLSSRPHLALPPELSYPVGTTPTAVAQRKLIDELLGDITGKLLPHIINIRKHYTPLSHQNGLHTDPFGRILMVLRDGEPYDGWEVEVQAANGLFQLEAKMLWEPSWWKHYQHKTTDIKHNALEAGKAHIYVFKLTNIGVAMALKEIHEGVAGLQDERNKTYAENMVGKGSSCMHFTNDSSTPTDPTQVDSKLHLSPWQNRAIVKAQNRIKQQEERANPVQAGITKPSDAKKRKAGVLSDNADTIDNNNVGAVTLTTEQRQEMANRFKAFTMTDEPTPTPTPATTTTTKKTKKALAAEAALKEEAIVQPVKKQKVDLEMNGVANNQKSRHLLDQLVQLDPVQPAQQAAVETKKKKGDKKAEEIKSTNNNSLATGALSLEALLALEADVAPELTKKRIEADEAEAKAKKEEERFQKEAEIKKKEVEAQKAAAKEAKLLAKKAEDAKKKEMEAEKKNKKNGKDDKKEATTLTTKKGKWDFSASDDMDLSREIFAMLTGSRPEDVDTDDDGEDLGNSDDDGDDVMGDDSDNGDDIPRSTFGLNKVPAAPLPKAKTAVAEKKSTPAKGKKETKVAAKTTKPVPSPAAAPVVSAFTGFGTGGIKAKKTSDDTAKAKVAAPLTKTKVNPFKAGKKA